VDAIVIIGRSLEVVKETFISMEKAAKEMGLTINENKTKFVALNDPAYLYLTYKRSFFVDSYNFEVATEFIYLGTLINSKIYLEEEIKSRITRIIGNRCYYGMLKLMKSQLLMRDTECQLYKTIILPTGNYGSESWTLSKAHEALLGGFERKTLRRIYGAVQIDRFWRRRYNKKLYGLFNDVDIIKRIKINGLRWAGHFIRKENEEIIKIIMLAKPEGKRKKGRP
jgi:hypothetical protein